MCFYNCFTQVFSSDRLIYIHTYVHIYIYLVVVGFELRALCLPDRCSTSCANVLHPEIDLHFRSRKMIAIESSIFLLFLTFVFCIFKEIFKKKMKKGILGLLIFLLLFVFLCVCSFLRQYLTV
jgi:hypothetical protein